MPETNTLDFLASQTLMAEQECWSPASFFNVRKYFSFGEAMEGEPLGQAPALLTKKNLAHTNDQAYFRRQRRRKKL
jgi:hypothetical protein